MLSVSRSLRHYSLWLTLAGTVVSCGGQSDQYRLGEVHLGMTLEELRSKYPDAKLQKAQLKGATPIMLGSLTIAGYENASVSLAQSEQDFIVISVTAGPSGPVWSSIRQDLERWNGRPDSTWSSSGHESAVWGSNSAPQYDGGISASPFARYCSQRCLIATNFENWVELNLLDMPRLDRAGLK